MFYILLLKVMVGKKFKIMKMNSADKIPSPLSEVKLLENSLFFNDATGKPLVTTRFTNIISTKDFF